MLRSTQSMAICQVCGTPVELPAPVVCELCETPHHDDCWRYLGSCSTFACTGLATGPPRAPRALRPLRVAGARTVAWKVEAPVVDFGEGPRPEIPKEGGALRLLTSHLPVRKDEDPVIGKGQCP